MPGHLQDDVLRDSLADPQAFWSRQADQLHWHRPPTTALRRARKTLADGVSHDTWTWFPDGEISTCYNCLDRHVEAGRGRQPALYYDSPVTGAAETYTYARLLDEVRVLAGVLREQGVRSADVVMLYMPMIPAAVVAMLAVNRLGAVHSVVFGGFAAPALAQRIDACRPVALLTASCGIDGAKPPIPYRPLVEEAVRLARHRPPRTLIWQREEARWGRTDRGAGQIVWQTAVRSARARRVGTECVAVASSDPVYVIHTSGTTGAPKGVRRDAGGHAVGLHLSARFLFGLRGPGDVAFTASDIGWVVGHSYIVYAPLLVGAASVLYEGKPVGTPDTSAFWRVVERYRVSTMFTAPTALRAIRRDDPDNAQLRLVGSRDGLRSLRALFLAGERSEPSLVSMYQRLLDEHGARPAAHVIDNWWSTESGSPITARALAPHAAGSADAPPPSSSSSSSSSSPGSSSAPSTPPGPPPIKPGSAGKPMPGFDVRVVDDDGAQLPPGTMGNIVLAMPLAPTGLCTLWDDDERFYRSYLRRFDGKWLDTGDAGRIDDEGYLHVMSRNDDVLNVSAHRLSSGAIEEAIASHPLVAECCVVGIPDALKGQMPLAFVALSSEPHPTSAVPDPGLAAELQGLVRRRVGPIASLGGVVQGRGMIPRTRSGKTLRRVLRDLVENAARGRAHHDVAVPSTVEDPAVIDVARAKVAEYWAEKGGLHAPTEDEQGAEQPKPKPKL